MISLPSFLLIGLRITECKFSADSLDDTLAVVAFAKEMMDAFISGHIDYCNSVLYGLPAYQI